MIAAAKTDRVFRLLKKSKEKIQDFPSNDLILLENQWNEAEQKYLLGLEKKEALDMVGARINYALLKTLDRISPEE